MKTIKMSEKISTIQTVSVILIIVAIIVSGVSVSYITSLSGKMDKLVSAESELSGKIDELTSAELELVSTVGDLGEVLGEYGEKIAGIEERIKALEEEAAKPTVEEVRIGCPWPLSGTAAHIGIDSKPMIEWYANKINEEGGIKSLGGAKIKLIFADTESKPEIARISAAKLITEDKCVALVDGVLSGNALTQSEECEKYHVPIVLGSSSSPTLTARGFKYIFRFWAHDKLLARELFKFLNYLEEENNIEVTKIAIVTDNTLFGVDCGKAYLEANDDPEIGGYEVVEHITIPKGLIDCTSEVARLKTSGAEVLFTAVTTAGDVILLQQTIEKMDFNFWALFSASGHLNPEYVDIGPTGWYVFTRTSHSPDIYTTKPHTKIYDDVYRELTGKPLFGYPNGAWIGLKIVVEAIERAASIDPEKIRDEIAATDISGWELPMPYKGIKFDETGQNIYATPCINQLWDGEWHLVGPEAIAAHTAVFPQLTWDER